MNICKKLSAVVPALVAAACIVLFLLLSVIFYRNNVKNMRTSQMLNETVVGECVENTVIEQTLVIPPTANKLTLLLATYQHEQTGNLTIQLVHYPQKQLIQEWVIPNETIIDNQEYPLELKNDFSRGNTDNRYAIIVRGDASCKPGSSPTIWQSATDTYAGGELYINGTQSSGDLCFVIHYQSTSVRGIYIFITCLLTLLLIASFLLLGKCGCRVENACVLYVLLLGIAYMVVFPAESAPDEDRHIISAYNVSNYMLGGPEAEEALVYFRGDDLTGLYGEIPNAESYISLTDNLGKPRQNEEYILVTEDFIIQTPFWTYLPQATGISLGRILHCNGTITILLGRLFALLFFAAATFVSIRIIPIGKKILLAISVLPMTLELAASYSYDSMILSLSFLFTALMCRLIFEKETLSIKDIVLPSLILMLLAPHKYVYIALGLLSLLLPGEKYQTKKEKWISVAILFGGVVLGLCALSGGPRISVPGIVTTEYRTIGYCLRNPKEILLVYMNTVMQSLPYYLSTMVGMSLGWLELHMPQEVLYLSVLMLFMATVKTGSESRITVRNRHYLTFSLCVLVVFFLTLTAMLLNWTPIWKYHIEGVQGRYFLPVLPLLLLCTQKLDIRSEKNMVMPIAYMAFWMNAMCLWRGFQLIAGR